MQIVEAFIMITWVKGRDWFDFDSFLIKKLHLRRVLSARPLIGHARDTFRLKRRFFLRSNMRQEANMRRVPSLVTKGSEKRSETKATFPAGKRERRKVLWIVQKRARDIEQSSLVVQSVVKSNLVH